MYGSFTYSDPNSALNEFEARLNMTYRCFTIRDSTMTSRRTKRQVDSQTSAPIYITIVGASEMENVFSINSTYGNVEYGM